MARVWVYQSDRFLTDEEAVEINSLLNDFVSSWTAHGSALAGKAYIKDNLFLIIEVDESVAGVTGCSIDKSVHFVKSLGNQFGVDFFDRMRVAYLDNAGNLAIADKDTFAQLVKAGQIKSDTIVYNNLVQNTEELARQWRLPFAESWHARIFS